MKGKLIGVIMLVCAAIITLQNFVPFEQKGSGILVGIIIIAFIGLFSFTHWYDQQQKKKEGRKNGK